MAWCLKATWANVDPNLCLRMVSPGHNEWNPGDAYIYGLVQDSSNSITDTLELPQSLLSHRYASVNCVHITVNSLI